MEDKIKIVIVDDHEIFRGGLKLLINRLKNVKVIAEASNGKEFLDLLEFNIPDIVLMDIEMPVMNGIEATKKAIERYPELKIIALTMFNDEEYVENMIEAGVKGFLLKNINKDNLDKAIQSVISGNNYYSEELFKYFTKKISHTDKKETPEIKLTQREIEIIKLSFEGLNNKEIADKLFISERTVVGHKSNLLSKTGCKSTIHLLAYVIKNKLINL
ncbi:MAG TPA: response regulator transcription factor [Bacteroidales bacterium]|mgnify:CR=1 FL=1|nr:response regulator transcription factor [Bacteroidales bacterium]HPS18090.1 response regulator transcription factor [Bacteroidales bacterium]